MQIISPITLFIENKYRTVNTKEDVSQWYNCFTDPECEDFLDKPDCCFNLENYYRDIDGECCPWWVLDKLYYAKINFTGFCSCTAKNIYINFVDKMEIVFLIRCTIHVNH